MKHMDAILKAFSTERNESGRNKVLTVIKHLIMREYSKDPYFSLSHSIHMIFTSTFSLSLIDGV